MNYTQIMREIENLKQTVLLVDDTMKHNVNVFWAALGIGLTLIGLVSFGWLKYFVADEVQRRLKDEVSNLLKEYSKLPDPYTPTLLMGWQGDNVHCWIDDNGYVTLEGVVYGGVSGQHIIGFPKFFRPEKELEIPLICSEGTGHCVIGIDGYVTIHARQNAKVRFGNIRFKAAQI